MPQRLKKTESLASGWENAHLRPGWFDQHAMLALVEEVLSDAKQKGYGHTRWVANMGWALEEKPGAEHLVEYCARLNQVFRVGPHGRKPG